MGEMLDEPREILVIVRNVQTSMTKLNKRCFMMQVFSNRATDDH
jgi:hypothetical protein